MQSIKPAGEIPKEFRLAFLIFSLESCPSTSNRMSFQRIPIFTLVAKPASLQNDTAFSKGVLHLIREFSVFTSNTFRGEGSVLCLEIDVHAVSL